jgi:tight adherence protein B
VDLQLLLPSVGIFLTIMFAAGGLILVARSYATKRVRDRLEGAILIGDGVSERVESIILRDIQLSTVPFLNTILSEAKWAQQLDRLLVQAGISLRLGTFVALMLLLFSIGAFAMMSTAHMPLLALPAGAFAGSIPILWARYRRQKRILSFEKLFPDALEMLVGALRAGLALPGAIQVVADESPDPVGQEFAILSEENRLGVDTKEALKRGGNLAEILERTAAVIRDRFRILGDVRSLTAHGRLSGFILALLPLGMAGVIMVVAPEYLKGLMADPLGRHLIVAAIVLQVVGLLIMRRIINIKV